MGRPGPAPKDPSERARRNADTVVGGDGWEEIDPESYDGEVPEIPEWVDVGPRGIAIYEYLTRLPQAQLYGPGTYFELWISLPLIERYFEKPGSENYKSLITTLGSALRLTEDDMQKSRVRWKKAAAEEESATSQHNAKVIELQERRNRLGG